MEVRGIAFIGRKTQVIKMIGQQKWDQFMQRLIQNVPFFASSILVTTLIPVKAYLRFHEELIKELFENHQDAYWLLGKESAEYALQSGPYRNFFDDHDITKFLKNGLHVLWTRYFSEGILQGDIREDCIHVTITGVSVHHVYFELGIMGFVHGACELVWQKKLIPQKITGIFAPPHTVYYTFTPTM